MSQFTTRFAKLIVECGWGGRRGLEGKPVHIYFPVPSYSLACALAEEAYRCGARRVDFTLLSTVLDALHVKHATDDALVEIPATWADRWNDLVDVRGATIRIEGFDSPLALATCDPKRVSRFEAARMAARKKFYSEGLQTGTTPWCVVPYLSLDWAKIIHPKLSPTAALTRLERDLTAILELDKADFIARWKKRGEKIARRAKLLDELRLDHLHFKGPGTDLVVGVTRKARFSGGMHDQGPQGFKFFANLPTFENYTTPDYRRTNGVVRLTRPVMINGQAVEGAKLWFKDGEVRKFTAKKGGAALGAMLKEDPGAKRLGEVALVGIDDSRIFQTGVVFRSILLDENAACHVAFGSAYADRLVGGTKMSPREKEKWGCNQSRVHVDCMISDEGTTVVGVSRDGDRTPIIVDGEWAGSFRNP